MSCEWKKTTLKEITIIIMGQSPQGAKCNSNGDGFPLLNGPTEFGSFHPDPKQYTTDPKKISEVGDILFCVRGSTTGRMNWSDRKYAIGRGLAAIQHKNGTEYNQYIKGVLDFVLPELLVSATGSTFPNVSRSQLYDIPIKIPPLPEQKRIAKILGDLDDKIEVNRRMNETLEGMAQALFKSWFVDFDPVIDNALDAGNDIPEELAPRAALRQEIKTKGEYTPLPKETRSLFPASFTYTPELGWIPEGWEIRKLKELVNVKYGKDHKSLDNGNYPVYGSGGIMRYAESYLYDGESVLIPRKGTLSNILYVNCAFWSVDTMFYTTFNIDNYAKYFYYQIIQFRLAERNVGSAVPSMTTKLLNSLNILNPSDRILKDFETKLLTVYAKIEHNVAESVTVSNIRDTLLPKLLSGVN